MPTIEELLNDTVTENHTVVNTDTDELNKLAAEIGLINEDEAMSGKPMNKEATMLHDLYLESYPGDADLLGQEKVASMEKEAAEIEEAMGAYAYDVFEHCVQGHIEKMAAELVEAHTHGEDHAHPQRMASNEDTSGDAMDTDGNDGAEGVAAMGTHPRGAVGEFQMHSHPNGEQIKQAALRKHLLLNQLQ